VILLKKNKTIKQRAETVLRVDQTQHKKIHIDKYLILFCPIPAQTHCYALPSGIKYAAGSKAGKDACLEDVSFLLQGWATVVRRRSEPAYWQNKSSPVCVCLKIFAKNPPASLLPCGSLTATLNLSPEMLSLRSFHKLSGISNLNKSGLTYEETIAVVLHRQV